LVVSRGNRHLIVRVDEDRRAAWYRWAAENDVTVSDLVRGAVDLVTGYYFGVAESVASSSSVSLPAAVAAAAVPAAASAHVGVTDVTDDATDLGPSPGVGYSVPVGTPDDRDGADDATAAVYAHDDPAAAVTGLAFPDSRYGTNPGGDAWKGTVFGR
jgi:hypothetical protein